MTQGPLYPDAPIPPMKQVSSLEHNPREFDRTLMKKVIRSLLISLDSRISVNNCERSDC